ncbi:Integrase-type DNA-binding superfamily protein [Klebsormidium nitens]|uniref:Integrase-type DNA-binding superfamily protein n=1 Tax=Klebsormidium nitens TaxID=105231 RepID=A0A1Y1I7T2_KLENI|nr:Integrase-type DNA-binding superfamily protein [Klebsormidium nitens]|eukprot:GAQ87025.1 Integrase-type DNA-binding superfamily protein [Klebsormidium nitens]
MGPGKKYIYLGLFDTEEEAAMAYDRALLRSSRCHNIVTNFSLPCEEAGGDIQMDQALTLQGPSTPAEIPPPPRLSYLSQLGTESRSTLSPRFTAPDCSQTYSSASPRVTTSSRPAAVTPSLFAPPSFHTSVVTSAGAQLSPRAGLAPSFGHLSGTPELPYLGSPVSGSLSLMRQDLLLTERARQLAAFQLAQTFWSRAQAPAASSAAAGGTGNWGAQERGAVASADPKALERAHLPLLHLHALSQLAGQSAGSVLPRGPLTHPALWQYLADVRMLEALKGVHHGAAYAPSAPTEEPAISQEQT